MNYEPILTPESPALSKTSNMIVFRRRDRPPADQRVQTIAGDTPWGERRCERTFGEISKFMDMIRCIIVRLVSIQYLHTEREYADIIAELDGNLFEHIDRNSERAVLNSEEQNCIFTRIVRNISNILPTEEGYKLVSGFYERMRDRKNESNRERKKEREPKGPWPLPKGWLFSVKFLHVRAHRPAAYTVWAANEEDAQRKALALFHAEFPKVAANGWSLKMEYVSRGTRGDWDWNRYFDKGGKCE